MPLFAPALLSDPRLQNRGNGTLRSDLVLQLQRTQGNQATLRLLHAGPAAPWGRAAQRLITQTTRRNDAGPLPAAAGLPIQRYTLRNDWHDPPVISDEDAITYRDGEWGTEQGFDQRTPLWKVKLYAADQLKKHEIAATPWCETAGKRVRLKAKTHTLFATEDLIAESNVALAKAGGKGSFIELQKGNNAVEVQVEDKN